MNYKIIDKDTYYRKGVFRHFTEDCKCSISMTARIGVPFWGQGLISEAVREMEGCEKVAMIIGNNAQARKSLKN